MANMFGFIFLFLQILVGFLSCESQHTPYSPDSTYDTTSGPLSKPQFKTFMFVQTWPPTYCKSKTCAQNPGRFTIHGLWPQNTSSPGTEQLTDAILEAHRTALLQYWPDLKTTDFQTSKDFWQREYKRHGVYCTTKYTAEEYIVKALHLGESFTTRNWLAKKNIVPDASKQYARSDIVAAIKSSTNVTPDLQCDLTGDYLQEIRLCLDDKLENLINCDGKVGNCETQVYYPPPPPPSGTETSDEVLEMTEDLINSII